MRPQEDIVGRVGPPSHHAKDCRHQFMAAVKARCLVITLSLTREVILGLDARIFPSVVMCQSSTDAVVTFQRLIALLTVPIVLISARNALLLAIAVTRT